MIAAGSLVHAPADPDDPLAPARGQSLEACSRCSSSSTAPRRPPSCAARWRRACSRERVLDELQREVERRLLRSRQFYDETQW